MVGNGTSLPISHTGHSTLNLYGGSSVTCDVLVVTSITKKLLSDAHLARRYNWSFLFTSSGYFIKDMKNDRLLHQGPLKGGLYSLGSSANKFCFAANKCSTDLWHARLGHPSHHILHHLYHELALPSIPSYTSPCGSCQLGKSHRLPFSPRESRSNSVLNIVHCDVWGPAPQISLDGFRFYLVLVDDYSRFTWFYPLKRKSDVLSIFPKFFSMVENICSSRIKYIQSDAGGKFFGHALQSYFHQRGIVHRLSCPGTPQQNGVAKRKHCHIVETGLTLLAHSKLTSPFWTHAFATAYISSIACPVPYLNFALLMLYFMVMSHLVLTCEFLDPSIILV